MPFDAGLTSTSSESLRTDLYDRKVATAPRADVIGLEASDPEWEAAWARELERRAAEADAHPEPGSPWPSARAELEAMLSQKP